MSIVIDTYRDALARGVFNYHRDTFRSGGIVYVPIPPDEPIALYDPAPVPVDKPVYYTAEYQLRHTNSFAVTAKHYAMFGRVKDTDDWIIVDGPWRVGDGPFD